MADVSVMCRIHKPHKGCFDSNLDVLQENGELLLSLPVVRNLDYNNNMIWYDMI